MMTSAQVVERSVDATTNILLRTLLIRAIILHQLVIRLLGSNHLHFKNYELIP